MSQHPPTNPGPATESASSDHRAPSPKVRALRAALTAEAALMAVGALAVVADLIVRGEFAGRQIAMAAFLVVCALGIAWALVAAGRALALGRRSGRSVAMTWQLFQAVVGATAIATGSAWAVLLGVILVVLAVGVAFLLLLPSVVTETTGR
jgi:hypothetical protein